MTEPLASPPQAKLTRLGRFRSREMERAYLAERWPQDAARMRLVCLITALADLLAFGLDMGNFSGWELGLMLSARGLAVAFGLGVARLTFVSRRPRRFNSALAVYMLLVGLHECVELWLMQPAHLLDAQLTVIIVLMFYLFLPPSLKTALAGGLGSTALYLATLVLATPAGTADAYAQLLFFGLANGFGIYFLINYGRAQRREFRVLREMRRVNEALSHQVSATAEANNRLEELAATDGLTGAMNRRRFFEVMEAEFVRARRYDHPLSVVMFDLDHFKRVNDRFGHADGDLALRHVAAMCMARQRAMDSFGRLGGEEFALLLPETGRDQARAVAERICVTLAKSPVTVSKGEVLLTLSAGVATIRNSDTNADALLRRADEALYGAKRNGRNQLFCPPEESEGRPD